MSSDLPNSVTPRRHLDLALQASNGDEDAARELFSAYDQQLRHFVRLRMEGALRNRLDASDIVQDTLMEANRRLKDYLHRQPMPLRIWLYKLASKQLGHARTKHLVRAKRTARREEPLPDRSSILLANRLVRPMTPSEHIMKQERNRKLAELIQRLGSMEREILLMRHMEGLNYQEISEILEITAASARQKYVRTLLWLRKLCVEAGIEGSLL